MTELLAVLRRELVYLWYYVDLQLRQIVWYWVLGMVLGSAVSVFLKDRIHNTALKKRLLAYSRRYPAICQQTDADPETGCVEFDIEKGRFSFRLTAPYSEERRRAASKAAKAVASNLTRSMV